MLAVAVVTCIASGNVNCRDGEFGMTWITRVALKESVALWAIVKQLNIVWAIYSIEPLVTQTGSVVMLTGCTTLTNPVSLLTVKILIGHDEEWSSL